MYSLIIVLIILVCVLLVGVVLIQESKGGGLAAGFSGGSQVMGVQRTNDILEKATWGFAIALLVLSLLATAVQTPAEIKREESEITDFVEGIQPVQNQAATQASGIPNPNDEE